MIETETFIVGEELPRIGSVSAHDDFQVAVTWETGSRAGHSEVVDLGPTIFSYKLYAPLRSAPDLFATVHTVNYGTAIAWGNDQIDMSAEGVEDLANQAMTSADLRAFLDRHAFTQEAAAAQLGISRRQLNYFLTSKTIPRTVALACSFLDTRPNKRLSEEIGSWSQDAADRVEASIQDFSDQIQASIKKDHSTVLNTPHGAKSSSRKKRHSIES